MATLRERLEEVMAEMGWSHANLVEISGETSSVVSQWLGKGSKEIKSIGSLEAALRLEAESGYSALWLAKGLEPKKVTFKRLPADAVVSGPSGTLYANAKAPTPRTLTQPGYDHRQAQALSLRPGEMWLPQYEGVRAMMGEGSDGASGEVVTLQRVSVEGLKRRLIRVPYTNLSNLKLLTAYGDSMSGTFEDGDVLLVDAGVRDFDRDGIYVYSRDGELQVKRLQKEDDGSLTVISDNPRYRDRRIARDDRSVYVVHGRALLTWTLRTL